MPRLPRYAAPGTPQHVIQRGNNRSSLFGSDADYRFFLECLRTACERFQCLVHAYVLMTNHVHVLMTPSTPGAIARVMQSVGRRYVRYFNTVHHRTGTLWEGRYRATVVDTESYLLACHRYIELNPVRAGLVANPGNYRWSSHRANAFGLRDPIVSPHACYTALDADAKARRAAYRALFIDPLDDATLEAIRDATNRGWALGTKSFREEIRALVQRRVEPATRGRRPRRNDEIRL